MHSPSQTRASFTLLRHLQFSFSYLSQALYSPPPSSLSFIIAFSSSSPSFSRNKFLYSVVPSKRVRVWYCIWFLKIPLDVVQIWFFHLQPSFYFPLTYHNFIAFTYFPSAFVFRFHLKGLHFASFLHWFYHFFILLFIRQDPLRLSTYILPKFYLGFLCWILISCRFNCKVSCSSFRYLFNHQILSPTLPFSFQKVHPMHDRQNPLFCSCFTHSSLPFSIYSHIDEKGTVYCTIIFVKRMNACHQF